MKTNRFGDEYWYNEKEQLHREDGPAIETIDGYKAWYINGQRHRTNGPAVIQPDNGYAKWYINLSISYT